MTELSPEEDEELDEENRVVALDVAETDVMTGFRKRDPAASCGHSDGESFFCDIEGERTHRQCLHLCTLK